MSLPRPGVMLFPSLWILGFYTPLISQYFYQTRWPVSIALGAAAVIFLIHGKAPFRDRTINLAMSLLIVLLFTSTIYSFMPTYTILRSVSAAILVASSYMIGIALVRSVDDVPRLFSVLFWLHVFFLIIIAMSAATSGFAFASGRFQGNEHLKATGTGGVLVSSGIFLLWYMRQASDGVKSLVTFALFVLITVALVSTRSRVPLASALILWPIAWSVCGGKSLGRGVALLLLTLCGIGLTILFFPETVSFLRLDTEELEQAGYGFSTGRFERWETLFHHGMDRPFIGHGFGTSRYLNFYLLTGGLGTIEWSQEINNTLYQTLAHNQHVQMFFEVGVLGLALFWVVLLDLFFCGVRLTLYYSGPYAILLKVIFLSCCYNLIDSWSHDGLLSSGNPGSYVFWFKVGVVVAGYRCMRLLERSRR